jgi:rod shape-determining protein MreC
VLRRCRIKLLFTQGPSVTIRAAIFVVLSMVIMFMDHRQHHLETIRSGLSILIYPLQYAVNVPSRITQWADTSLSTHNTLVDENRTLKAQVFEQQTRLLKFASLESENQRLRELLQSVNRGWERVQIAELLSVDLDPFRRQMQLNKGSNDSIFEGQPLLDAHGVMGQVISVNAFSSTAMLITDPSHAIPVQVNRNGLRAIALGTGAADELDIPHIPNNADIEVGDLLISSGLGQRFPADYPVAEVVSVERDPREPFARITARPTARLEQAREVLLVWPQERTETPPAQPAAAAQPAVQSQPAAPSHPAAPSQTVASPSSPAAPSQAVASPSSPAAPSQAVAPARPATPPPATAPTRPAASQPAVPSRPAAPAQPAPSGVTP